MDWRNIGAGGLVAVITGLAAIGMPQGLRANSSGGSVTAMTTSMPIAEADLTSLMWPSPSGSDGAASLTPSPHRSAVLLLNEFFNGQDTSPTPPPASLSDEKVNWPGTGSYELKTMIVTLPDPVAPSLRYIFDGHLDAIQHALESQSYTVDRSDLPWPSLNGNESSQRIEVEQLTEGITPDASKDPLTLAAQRYEHEPGVILFRNMNSPTSGKLLLLFIVGETPTGGIRKDALINALDQIDCFSDHVKEAADSCLTAPSTKRPSNTQPPLISILGPTFSGSMSSLNIAWDEWDGDHNHKYARKIISGSATAVDPKMAGTGDFHVTVVPDAITLREIVDFLKQDMGARDGEIASLSEANTVFGRLRDTSADSTDTQMLHLYFPVRISSLRTTIAKEKASAPQTQVEPSTTVVPIPPDEAGSSGYVISSVVAEDYRIRRRNLVESDMEHRPRTHPLRHPAGKRCGRRDFPRSANQKTCAEHHTDYDLGGPSIPASR